MKARKALAKKVKTDMEHTMRLTGVSCCSSTVSLLEEIILKSEDTLARPIIEKIMHTYDMCISNSVEPVTSQIVVYQDAVREYLAEL